jgi:transposase
MGSIVRKKIGNQIYLYESESYRNEEGKPRTRQKFIGKINPATGQDEFKPEYLNKKGIHGNSNKSIQGEAVFSVTAIKNSTVREFVAYYLYEKIAESSGLLDVLKESFPYRWEQIFNLSCFLVACGEPLLYCEEWIFKTECIPCPSLSSQRISELFQSISIDERMYFYENWAKFRCEHEYLALDITSISSYSELIGDVEWGYNRDKEKLPQINLCLLMGEKTRLPVFQVTYSGSISDVSTLKTTLNLASNIPLENTTIVTDKGFCKIKNINDLLADNRGFKFLIAMSFSLKFSKDIVANQKGIIDKFENTIVLGDDVICGVTLEKMWNKKYKVYAHVFYDNAHATQVRNRLFGRITTLIECAKKDPNDTDFATDFTKYLDIKTVENITEVSVKHDVIEDELRHVGWLVLLSSNISNARDAIRIYRAKDVVEKGFMRMKNNLDLGRLRVQSDNAVQNKIFIGFIALIIMCFIHNTMSEKDLYKNLTMKSMLKILEKLKVQYVNGSRILFPLTKQQRNILEHFGFPEPV